MPTDIQFKDDLRKELIMYEDYLDLLKNGEIEKLKKSLRITLSESMKVYRISAQLEEQINTKCLLFYSVHYQDST